MNCVTLFKSSSLGASLISSHCVVSIGLEGQCSNFILFIFFFSYPLSLVSLIKARSRPSMLCIPEQCHLNTNCLSYNRKSKENLFSVVNRFYLDSAREKTRNTKLLQKLVFEMLLN